MARVDDAPRLPEAPRLPPAMPRSGVSAEARLALRQLLGDNERALADAFRNGADARALTRVRAQAVEHVVVHVWRACVGDAPDAALFAVGGFGRGFAVPVFRCRSARADRARRAGASRARVRSVLRVPVGSRPQARPRRARARRMPRARRAGRCHRVHESARRAAPGRFGASRRRARCDRRRSNALAARRIPRRQARRAGRAPRALQRHRPTTSNRTSRTVRADCARSICCAGSAGASRAQPISMRWSRRALLDPTERAALDRSEATLRRYRYALHLAAGRAEERLAVRLSARARRRARLSATSTRRISPSSSSCRAITAPRRSSSGSARRSPSASWSCSIRRRDQPREIDRDFVALGARLEPRSATLFERRPRAMVDAFALLLDHPELRGLSAEAMRRLQRALARHGRRFRRRSVTCSLRFSRCCAAARASVERARRDESARRARRAAADVPARRRPHAVRPVPCLHGRRAHAARAAQRRALRRSCGARGISDRERDLAHARKTGAAAARRDVPRHRQGPRRRSFGARRRGSARVLRQARPCAKPTSISSPGWCAGI